MRILNLVTAARQINEQLNSLLARQAEQTPFKPGEEELNYILEKLTSIQEKITQLCEKQGGSPEDLPTPSFKAYQWVKFIGQRKWLYAHLYGMHEFFQVAATVTAQPNITAIHQKLAIYCSYSNYLYRTRQSGSLTIVEVNEGFISAPREIKEAILASALKRRTASRIQTIRRYTHSDTYTQIQAALQANPGANRLAGQGGVYNLAEAFERLNLQYFEGRMAQPRLLWSARASLRRLGTYQVESDTITISKRLDQSDVPEILLSYVLYHEMLHKHIGLKSVNGRRYAHTRAFREEEERFVQHTAAEKAMHELGRRLR